MPLPRLLLLTLLTLTAFAANSVLCRLALFEERMDPALFTLLRLTSGALMLILLCRVRHQSPRQGDWGGALALIAYGAAFSFAYLTLTAGTGALLLFAAVQLSMLAPPLLRGESLPLRQWAGLLLAMAGLVLLLLPGIRAPDPLGAALMIGAGIAWACYTLRASRFADPIAANAGHFLRASLPAALLYLLLGRLEASPAAIGYALASGALASGLGYALWYLVLPQLGRTLAASVQLLVPLLAALAGIIWLDESWSLRLLLSSLGILGGIALVITGRPHKETKHDEDGHFAARQQPVERPARHRAGSGNPSSRAGSGLFRRPATADRAGPTAAHRRLHQGGGQNDPLPAGVCQLRPARGQQASRFFQGARLPAGRGLSQELPAISRGESMIPPRELTLQFLAEPADVNFGGKVHGGMVMKWIDQAGYACAAGWCGGYAVTVYVGGIRFLRPIQIGQLVEVHAKVIHTGTTSMHLAVDVYSRHPTDPARHKTTHCIIIFVAMDEHGKPSPVPQWQPVSEQDLQLQQYARKLMTLREELDKEMRQHM